MCHGLRTRSGWLLVATVIAAVMACAAPALAGQVAAVMPPASRLGIREAIDDVLARSVAAQTARLDVDTQLQQAALARRDFMPQATLSGQTERTSDTNSSNAALASTWKLRSGATVLGTVGRSVVRNPGVLDTHRHTNTTTVQSIGLTQPLLRGAGVEAATLTERLAELSASGARRDFTESIADLVFKTITAYFALEQARRNVDLAHETIGRLAKVRAVNEALLAAGRIPRTTLLQNDVDEAQATFSLAQSKQAETVARRTLLRLIARDAQEAEQTELVLQDSFVDHADGAPPPESQAVAIALERRSDVRSARSAVTSARLAWVGARDASRDQLDVYVKVDRQRSTSPFASSATTNVPAIGVSFSMTLDKTAQHTAVNAANVAVTKSELALAETERSAISETRDAVRAIDFAQTQYRLSQRTAELAARRLDDEVEKARAGRSSATELTQAQDALRDASSQEVQARYAIFTARLDLQRVTGTLLERWGVAERTASMLPAEP
jgi:outer membrane protein TolC